MYVTTVIRIRVGDIKNRNAPINKSLQSSKLFQRGNLVMVYQPRCNKYEQWPSSHDADCEQNDWQTLVKTLPSPVVSNNSLIFWSLDFMIRMKCHCQCVNTSIIGENMFEIKKTAGGIVFGVKWMATLTMFCFGRMFAFLSSLLP